MNIHEQIKIQIAKRKAAVNALTELGRRIRDEGIELEQTYLSICVPFIDFNNPSRKDVEKIMFFLKAGKWDKVKASSTTLHYTTRDEFIPNFRLRLYAAEPPGSCRVIKRIVEVPEKIIPAHTETIQELQCTPSSEETTYTT